MLFQEDSPTIQECRINKVISNLIKYNVESILDIGCGPGDFTERLAELSKIKHIVGIDTSYSALNLARTRVNSLPEGLKEKITLFNNSIFEIGEEYKNIDAVILIEVIEHIEPNRLSSLEKIIFEDIGPKIVLITTPNSDYNPIYEIPKGEFRQHDHHFEWSRIKFQSWCRGVSTRCNYSVFFDDIGPKDINFGSSTQMAVFNNNIDLR